VIGGGGNLTPPGDGTGRPPISLPGPARYFPAQNGRYGVAPSLRPLGTPFGNGEADGRVFQLDIQFPEYRENALRCLRERPGKYSGSRDYPPPVAAAIARFFSERLAEEYPALFSLEQGHGGARFACRLTGETLSFNGKMELTDVSGTVPAHPGYRNALDALCSQVQEDAAVVVEAEGGRDHLAAYHVCAPSHWAPEAKSGLGFAAVHAPVPGMETVNRVAGAMVDAMVRRGPFVRFVWGIDTHRGLNRHPEPPPGIPPGDWWSPAFDGTLSSPFVLRVERQVTWGLPEVGAALFLIRLSLTEASELDREQQALLRSALLSMSPESRAYKGITAYAEALLAYLEG